MPSAALAIAGANVNPATAASAVPDRPRYHRILYSSLSFFGRRYRPYSMTLASAAAIPVWGVVQECAPLVGERPHPQFLLANLPQPGKPGRFDDQKQHDQCADDHELDVLNRRGMHGYAEFRRQITQHDRQNENERGAKERPGQAAETTDDDHEENKEAQIDVEDRRFGAAIPEKHQKRSGDTAVERGCRECQQLCLQQSDTNEV